MYKTYIETKHENRDRLGPSEMGSAGYLLTHPRIFLTSQRKHMLWVLIRSASPRRF